MAVRRVPGGGSWKKPLPEDPDAFVSRTVQRYEEHSGAALARLMRFMGMATLEWEARGAVVRDAHGNEYLECGGYGVFFHGHSHPTVVRAVQRQAEELALSTRMLLNLPQAVLGERLAAVAPEGLQYSFLCNSGAESVEAALKLARAATGRRSILATGGAFHGKTYGALSASGKDMYRDPFVPLVGGFSHVPFGDAAALEAEANHLAESEGGLAAIILEPIQGEGGVIVPPDHYLQAARAVCDRFGALLILDEVQTGIGRTGSMFACTQWDVVPDILTTAKSLGGGVMPVAAMMARRACWHPFDDHPFIHTSTFGGSPLACAAAIAALDVIATEDLLGRAQRLGSVLGDGLSAIARRYPGAIAAVRGRGLLWGIELRSEGAGGMLLNLLIDAGVLVVYSLNMPRVIRIMPPAIMSEEQMAFVLDAMDRAARATEEVASEL